MLDSIDRSVQFPNRFRAMPVAGTKDILDLVPAPGEVNEEGTLWNRRASQLMQGDRRYYPVKAGQSIHAGDVVDVVGGEVGKSFVPVSNVETTTGGSSISGADVCALTSARSVTMTTPATSGNTAGLCLFNTSGLAPVKVYGESGLSGAINSRNPSISRLNDTKFAAGYVVNSNLYASICTALGDAISAGAQYALSVATTTGGKLLGLGDNQLFAVYNRSGLKAKVFPVTDTVINTTSTTEKPLPGNTSASYLSATRLPDLNGNERVCVCFSDGSDGNKGKAVIATVKPDNTVEWGSVVRFYPNQIAGSDCAYANGAVHVSFCLGNSIPENEGCIKVLPLNENTLDVSIPKKTLYQTYPAYTSIKAVGEKVVAIFSHPNNNPKAFVVKWDGAAIMAGNGYEFNNGAARYLSSDAISDHGLVVAYADANNSDYGTSTILTVQGDQIAGSFTDTSSDCIALQDAAPVQPCEVIFDGVAELPGFVAGTEINSPGVYGYCPEDGRVWVRPEWDGNKVVTGSYIGTGSSGASSPNTLTFPFKPKLVILQSDPGDVSYGKNTGATILYGCRALRLWDTYGASIDANRVTWDNQTMSWYTGNASYQLNSEGMKYRYIAIG